MVLWRLHVQGLVRCPLTVLMPLSVRVADAELGGAFLIEAGHPLPAAGVLGEPSPTGQTGPREKQSQETRLRPPVGLRDIRLSQLLALGVLLMQKRARCWPPSCRLLAPHACSPARQATAAQALVPVTPSLGRRLSTSCVRRLHAGYRGPVDATRQPPVLRGGRVGANDKHAR